MGQLWRRRSVLAAGIVGVAAAGVASGAWIAWRPASTSAAPTGLPPATATIYPADARRRAFAGERKDVFVVPVAAGFGG
ncbi:MAG TPA: hypothetical protein DGT23_34455 [Micromonosporaceae bacterium]|nr:hypothetical protein [Micromonosporaceae bacterium]